MPGQLSGHVYLPELSTFGRRHFAVGIVSLDQQETALEIEITPAAQHFLFRMALNLRLSICRQS